MRLWKAKSPANLHACKKPPVGTMLTASRNASHIRTQTNLPPLVPNFQRHYVLHLIKPLQRNLGCLNLCFEPKVAVQLGA